MDYKIPNLNYRKYQRETIESALKAFFEKGYDNVLIDAPTGFGKSITNYIIAMNFEDAWYTTPQVILLDQLENDKMIEKLGGIAIIKGRDKYLCPILAKQAKISDLFETTDEEGVKPKYEYSCASAPCVSRKKFNCPEICPYLVAKEKAQNSKISGMSFAFMILTRRVESWGKRHLLIVDEGDDIEGWATDFGTLTFRTPESFESIYDVVYWAKSKLSRIRQEISFYENASFLTPQLMKKLDNLRKTESKLELFLETAESNPNNWTFRKSGAKLEVKPIFPDTILNRTVWNRGEKRLITSGTIINAELFKKFVGLPGKTLYLRVPHTFPVENRKIIYSPVGKMTKEERNNTYQPLVDKIAEIVEKHEGNILIHAHSYEIAQEIAKRLEVNRKVIIHDSKNRDEKLKEFLNSKNAVFISVGFSRGLDLKYDLCRCQIITKVPYPDITDIRVKEIWIKRKNWRWARYQAIKNIVQASGRIVRAPDDYGITYILDSSFEHLFKFKKEFPDWFTRAIYFDNIKESSIITF